MNYGQGGHQSYPQDLQICYRLFFIAVLIISLRCRHNWAVLIFTNNSLHTTVGPISQWSVPFMFQLTSSSLRRHKMLIFSALLAFCEGNPRSGHRWIALATASNVGFWCSLWCAPEQTFEQTVEMLVFWDAMALIVTSFYLCFERSYSCIWLGVCVFYVWVRVNAVVFFTCH